MQRFALALALALAGVVALAPRATTPAPLAPLQWSPVAFDCYGMLHAMASHGDHRPVARYIALECSAAIAGAVGYISHWRREARACIITAGWIANGVDKATAYGTVNVLHEYGCGPLLQQAIIAPSPAGDGPASPSPASPWKVAPANVSRGRRRPSRGEGDAGDAGDAARAKARAWYAMPTIDVEYYAKASRRLLTVEGNPKLDKGREATGEWIAVVHMAPFTTLPGANVCREAGAAGCYSTCLWRAGHGGIAPLDRVGGAAYARLHRTAYWHYRREAFIAKLQREAIAFADMARDKGYRPVLRLNGTSDIPYEVEAPAMVAKLLQHGVALRDYTKLHDRVTPDGYELIWSHSGAAGYRDRLHDAMQRYGRVTVVFAVRPAKGDRPGDPLPATFEGYPVVDGDAHDAWWLQPKGSIVGLRLKGDHAWRGWHAGKRPAFVVAVDNV